LPTRSVSLARPEPAGAHAAGPVGLPRVSSWTGHLCVLLAVVVLAGWALGIGELTTVAPGLVSMKANTAVCFALAGLALIAWHRREVDPRWSRVGAVAAGGVVAIAVITVAEYAIGIDPGIDQLLVHTTSSNPQQPPGRPSLATAIAFSAAGSALALMWRRGPRTAEVVAALGWFTGVIGFLAVVGYSAQFHTLTGIQPYASVALHTAAGLTLLGPAIAMTQPSATTVRALAAPTPGGALLRWMLPAAILVPLVFGVLHGRLVEEGIVDFDLASWIRAGGVMLLVSATAVYAARHLDALERQRQVTLDALQEANEQLQAANEELEQFASVASHDLAEPLRTITGFSQLLSDRYADQLDDDAKRWIEHIVVGGDRMQDLIRDLLDFSRAGHAEIACVATDMGALVDRVVARLDHAVTEARATIEVAALPPAFGDPRLLAQVFQNLIANAIKFGGPSPAVAVRGHRTPAGSRFEVSDNGIGIEQEHVARIFGMFERLNRREDYDGTGIGLAICQRIIERHGGEITVESSPGRGSTFAFTLPGEAA
jgi:signal transduction histidine kinase